MVNYKAAQRGSKRGCDRGGARPMPDCGAPDIPGKGRSNNRKTLRDHERGAGALYQACDDEDDGSRSQSAADGSECKQNNSGEEDTPTPVPVAGASSGHKKSAKCQGIGVHNPLESCKTCLQVVLNGGQGNRHDCAVDEGHCRCEDCSGKEVGSDALCARSALC